MSAVKNRPAALPNVTGVARWFRPGTTVSLDAALAQGTACLRVATETQTADYWVERIVDEGGEVTGYRLTKWVQEGAGERARETHTVDLRQGSCTCRDYLYRAQRRPDRRCRHLAGLAAALRAAGQA
jgi:hypothetical protein